MSTLTGTQVMLLVASETGHVYTFATPKLQPMITSDTGKALIQTCLNSPDPMHLLGGDPDVRMSQSGYEETDLAYPPVPEEEQKLNVSHSTCLLTFSSNNYVSVTIHVGSAYFSQVVTFVCSSLYRIYLQSAVECPR